MPPKKSKTKQFNVMMSPADRTMVDQLSEQLQVTAGEVVRKAVLYFHAHQIKGIPQCANGRPCMVPQLHAQQTTPQTGAGG